MQNIVHQTVGDDISIIGKKLTSTCWVICLECKYDLIVDLIFPVLSHSSSSLHQSSGLTKTHSRHSVTK